MSRHGAQARRISAMLTRLGPPLAIFLLAGPIVAGLVGTLLPAFGYLPALGGSGLTLAPLASLLGTPGIWMSVMLSLGVGLATTAVSLLTRHAVRRRVVGHADFLAHPASRVAAAVGAACCRGLRAGLPDRSVRHACADRLPRPDRLGAATRPADRPRPGGPGHDGGADRQGNPLPAADCPCRAAADRCRAHPRACGLAWLRPRRRLPAWFLAAALPTDPARGLRRHRLLDLGRRRGADSRADHAGAACGTAGRLDAGPGPVDALSRFRRRAAAALRDGAGDPDLGRHWNMSPAQCAVRHPRHGLALSQRRLAARRRSRGHDDCRPDGLRRSGDACAVVGGGAVAISRTRCPTG